MNAASRSRVRRLATVAVAGASVLTLGACAAGGAPADDDYGLFNVMVIAESPASLKVLPALAEGACAAENEAMPLNIETVPIASLDQKLQLLAGQDALPSMFPAGYTPSIAHELADAGQILDLEPVLTELGAIDNVKPSAIETVKAIYGGKMNAFPTFIGIDAFLYNKALLEQVGVEEPTTWAELEDALDALQAAGIQPFGLSGVAGSQPPRVFGSYLFQSVGLDAMQAIEDGEAKLTDPEYLEGAELIAEWGDAGYFGNGIAAVTADQVNTAFLNGQVGFIWGTSGMLGLLNNPEANLIGAENVGIMPIPTIDGEGQEDLYVANVGIPFAVGAKAYNDGVGAWLTCLSENYAAEALGSLGILSGMTVNSEVAEVPLLTQEFMDIADNIETSVVWFEALMGSKATTTADSNSGLLVDGVMSPEDYMAAIQADLDAE